MVAKENPFSLKIWIGTQLLILSIPPYLPHSKRMKFKISYSLLITIKPIGPMVFQLSSTEISGNM